MQKISITLDAMDLQNIERIVLDGDKYMALAFVQKTIKPRIDAAWGKGHCKPIFEWRRGQQEKIQPPPIKQE